MTYSNLNMVQLREALEASWKPDTAHLEVEEDGNPTLVLIALPDC